MDFGILWVEISYVYSIIKSGLSNFNMSREIRAGTLAWNLCQVNLSLGIKGRQCCRAVIMRMQYVMGKSTTSFLKCDLDLILF